MAKCRLVVNKLSGNANKKINVEDVENLLKESFEQVDVSFIDEDHDVLIKDLVDGYDALAVCGGDGEALLIAHGEPLRKIPEDRIVAELIAELKKLKTHG